MKRIFFRKVSPELLTRDSRFSGFQRRPAGIHGIRPRCFLQLSLAAQKAFSTRSLHSRKVANTAISKVRHALLALDDAFVSPDAFGMRRCSGGGNGTHHAADRSSVVAVE